MKNLALVLFCALLISCSEKKPIEVKQYSIDQFYKSTRIIGGAFNADETKLLIGSDKTGIFNVFEITIADSSRKQITQSTVESFFAMDYVPGTGKILYGADKGGNEIDHIYLLEEDGTTRDLTPGDNAKSGFIGWSKNKKFMYYGSNKRDPQFFDIYKMSIADWKPVMLYKYDNGLDFTGISDDENYISLQRPITTSENQLFLLNRATGKLTEVSDSAMPGTYNSSDFSMDGKHFYYITDAGKEFAYLVDYEIATGTKKTLFETKWDVMYSYTSENEKFRVIAINEDGKNSIIVKNNATGENLDFPIIADGNVLDVNISDKE